MQVYELQYLHSIGRASSEQCHQEAVRQVAAEAVTGRAARAAAVKQSTAVRNLFRSFIVLVSFLFDACLHGAGMQGAPFQTFVSTALRRRIWKSFFLLTGPASILALMAGDVMYGIHGKTGKSFQWRAGAAGRRGLKKISSG